MGAWSAENPQGSHGVHEYALEDFGITAGSVRDVFGFYTDHFAVDTTGLGDGGER